MGERPGLPALRDPQRGAFASVRRGAAVPLFVVWASIFAACADNFEPIDPGGPPFSVFGYLDASADTQWIRVTPLRTVLRGSADPTGVAVTLEELASGRIIALRDSAMRYPDMLGSDSLYAHNFWTAVRIEPGATYRFRAEGTDGALAQSVVSIPRDYDLEVWVSQYFKGFTYLRAQGLRQVAFIFWNTDYYDGCHTSRFFRKIQYVAPGGDSLAHMIMRPDYSKELPGCDSPRVTITRQNVEVAGSETPWPHGEDYSTWRLLPDSAASNVTGALGFLGGVLTKWTRAEDCVLPGPASPDSFCKLRYDSTTATLRGTLSSPCTVPPDSVHIVLRELAPSGELPRTRFGILDPAGSYDVGALRPGIPHQLIISVSDTTGRFFPRLPFPIIYDTLQFTAGQVATRHATLEPTGPCPRL
jgi:hypothetical protein